MSEALPESRVDQIAGGVFLIGIALLFLTPIGFFPGILFVIGASSLARGLAEGRQWYSVQGALWMIGLGLLFTVGFNIGLLLLLIGASMLFGYLFKPPMFDRDEADDLPPSAAALEVASFPDEYDEKPKRKAKNNGENGDW